MAAPVREEGETRRLIVEYLKNTARPMTWPEITKAVGITAGYRTQERMLHDRQIQEAGVDEAGIQLYCPAN